MEYIFKNCVVRKRNNGGVMYERENKCCYVEYLKIIFIEIMQYMMNIKRK